MKVEYIVVDWLIDWLPRNTIFKGNLDDVFTHFGSKIAKSDYFRGFYFSQSLSHIPGNKIVSVFLRDWKLKFCLRNSISGPFGS